MNELDWVEFLKTKAGKGKDVLTGIGDDCALVKVGAEKFLLKSDLFIEDIHFKLNEMNFKDIGKRAVARVLSDFAACGGVPKFIGISLGFPGYIKTKDLKEVAEGVMEYSKKYKFSLIGGDTSKSEKLFLDVWGVGVTKKCILRSTAKIGDYIFITGKLGARKFNRPFEPRIKESQNLIKKYKINSMIDISDGFIIDLYRILKDSNKGAILYSESIPCTAGKSDLYRGEDYELIFTVDKTENKIEVLKKNFHFVGKITSAKQGFMIREEGVVKKVKVKGYSHL